MKWKKSYYGNMTKEKAHRIRELYFTGLWKQTELAEMYNIRQGSVSRIVSGAVW